MSDRTSDPTTLGAGIGLVFGAGLGTILGSLFSLSIGATTGYGVGTGLVVGAAAGRLAVANRGQTDIPVRLLGGAAVLGGLAGAPVGAVAAWTHGDSMMSGLAVGAAAGLAHGLLVGAILLATIPDTDDS